MTEPEDKTEPRLEGMLQQWGAEEAIHEAHRLRLHPPRMPFGAASMLFRWGPLAAGLLLAVGSAAVVLFSADYYYKAGQQASKVGPAVGAASQPATGSVAAASQPADELTDKEVAIVKYFQDQFDELSIQLGHEKEELLFALADARIEAGEIKEQLKKKEGLEKRLADLQEQIVALKKDLQQRVDTATTQHTQDRQRIVDLQREVDNIRKMHTEALAAQRQAESELVRLKTLSQGQLADTQLAYFSSALQAVKGGDEGQITLAVRQEAVRLNKLLPRCPKIRPLANPQTLDLLDRLEASLQRLDVMDLSDAAAVRSFRKTIVDADLISKIDAGLVAQNQPASVRLWLTEARMVLAGAQREE